MNELYLKRIQALPDDKRSVLVGKLETWIRTRNGNRGEAQSLRVFYVPRGAVSPKDLHSFLSDRLPSYLIPSEYIALKSLPKTVNGKVDRLALQSLAGHDSTSEISVPTELLGSDRERQLIAIWSGVLGVTAIDRNSNFFELGGHSLLATQVIMEIERAYGLEIPLGAIFKYPTVALLSEYLSSAPRTAERTPRNKVLPPASTTVATAPVTTSQRRMWYASQLSDKGLEYKLVKVIDIKGPLSINTLAQSVTEIVNRHETLRTSFAYHAGDLVQRIYPPGPFSVEFVDLSGLPAEMAEIASAGIQKNVLHRSFDLEKESGIRMTLLRFGQSHSRILVDLHHIVVDGWSVGLLVREINALFRSFLAGEPSSLDPLPLRFRDVVAHERRLLTQPRINEQISYWRSQLADMPPLKFLHEQSDSASHEDGEIEISLGAETSAGIVGACNRLCITPFIFLLSAYHVVLQLHSHSLDIPIATDVANREARDCANLIGFFVNQVVLRIQSAPGLTFAQLCGRTRAVVTDAFANKDVPFEVVVRAALPNQRESILQLSRAMFSFHHVLPDFTIPGLSVRLIDAKPPATKYCLLLNMEESSNGLRGSIEYSGIVFDRNKAERMASDFTAICRLASSDLDTPLSILRDSALATDNARARLSASKIELPATGGLTQFVAVPCSPHSAITENQ
jgi:acyl carrier protein